MVKAAPEAGSLMVEDEKEAFKSSEGREGSRVEGWGKRPRGNVKWPSSMTAK